VAPTRASEHGGTRAGLLVLAVTIMVQANAAFAALSLAAIAPVVGRALDVPASLIGIQISLVYGGAAVSSLFSGGLVPRYGACRFSQFSMLLVAAGCALATIPTLGTLILGSMVVGVGYGMTNPSASTLLIRFAPVHRRNLIFSIKQTGVPLGGVMAGLIAPTVALAFGWWAAPATVAVLALLMAAGLETVRESWDRDREPEAPAGQSPIEGLRLVWRIPALRWLSKACFWFSLTQLCLIGFLVTLLVEDVGFSLIEAGFLLSAAQVAGAVGRVSWGWVADRVGDGLGVLVVLGLLMVLGSGLMMMLGPTWSPFAVQLIVVLLGATAVGWNGVYIAEVARLSPKGKVSTATGGSLSIIFAGVLVGPSLFAALYTSLGSYPATFVLTAMASLAGALSAVVARRCAAGTSYRSRQVSLCRASPVPSDDSSRDP
jgi:MFS family permease